ncbi:MAG: DUF1697 domain-containing protein [Spirochaetia bacterium]|nr:DUF1697 domain-containing protein [Spirochaetia bacterium]
MLEDAGLIEVQTYIQSGNVIAKSHLSRDEIQKLVHRAIKQNFGGDIAAISRTAKEFQAIVPAHPFGKVATEKLYFTIMQSPGKPALVKEFSGRDYSPDQIRIKKDVIYTLCATKYSDLKINNNVIERKLGIAATTRNYNTMTKLAELSQITASKTKPGKSATGKSSKTY